MYGSEVSSTLISSVTDAVMDEVNARQSRPLESIYRIVHQVRNSLNYDGWKIRKQVADDLKRTYQPATAEEAHQ